MEALVRQSFRIPALRHMAGSILQSWDSWGLVLRLRKGPGLESQSYKLCQDFPASISSFMTQNSHSLSPVQVSRRAPQDQMLREGPWQTQIHSFLLLVTKCGPQVFSLVLSGVAGPRLAQIPHSVGTADRAERCS